MIKISSALNTIRLNIFATIIFMPTLLFLTFPSPVSAAEGDRCAPNDPPQQGLVCGNCSSQGCVWTKNTSATQTPQKLEDNPIVEDINVIVNFLSIGVGIVVIAMIIIGGIQYSAAGDNPQALTNAKQRIINALIALVAYLFIFAFLQWLVPGGVF